MKYIVRFDRQHGEVRARFERHKLTRVVRGSGETFRGALRDLRLSAFMRGEEPLVRLCRRLAERRRSQSANAFSQA